MDFEPLVSTLTFNSSISSNCVPLVSLEDNDYEFDELFSVVLDSSDIQVVVDTLSVQVTIMDDDDRECMKFLAYVCTMTKLSVVVSLHVGLSNTQLFCLCPFLTLSARVLTLLRCA